MKNITLIIPAKDESESLPIVLNNLKKFGFKTMVVLDKTDKKTINSIKKFKVKVIFQNNKGYGDALIKGINNCKTKFFCIFNADGSFRAIEIIKMKHFLIKHNLDFVFGSRYQKNSGSEDDTFITLLGNYFFSKIGQLFFNLPITDILYTFVLGKTFNAKKLKLNQKNFSFCVELPIKAVKKNMPIKSINSFEYRRIAGLKKVSEFRDGLKILIYMIKFFFKHKI
jgi:glycosyltransferase involved in cell wall biosynthesis